MPPTFSLLLVDFSTGIAFSTSLDFLLSVLQEWGIFFMGMEILQALEVSATGRGITFLTFFFKKSIKKYKNKLNRSLFKYIYYYCVYIFRNLNIFGLCINLNVSKVK